MPEFSSEPGLLKRERMQDCNVPKSRPTKSFLFFESASLTDEFSVLSSSGFGSLLSVMIDRQFSYFCIFAKTLARQSNENLFFHQTDSPESTSSIICSISSKRSPIPLGGSRCSISSSFKSSISSTTSVFSSGNSSIGLSFSAFSGVVGIS